MSLLNDHDKNLAREINYLANGSEIPYDSDYIESYNYVFEKLKTIFQGKNGYPNFIKRRSLELELSNNIKLNKLTKKGLDEYLNLSYSNIVEDNKQSYSDYVEETSLELYSAVLGQERVVLSHVGKNLSEFKKDKAIKEDVEKIKNINSLLYIIEYGTLQAKEFLYVMIGKVLEGSLSQARKSIGGDLAEKIINVLLAKNNFVVKSQDGSQTATNTDLVVTTNKGEHCIAVQLSTNDRMRLSTDEYRKGSTNYLISLNGCSVSKKDLTDISLQRMSTWTKESVKHGKPIPFYVGRNIFVESLRRKFSEKFLNEVDLNPEDNSINIIDYVESLKNERIEKFMYLYLWAIKHTLTFEEFIEKIKREESI